MNKTDFLKALAFTLQWEGGYVNHPADPGGETNRGITHNTYTNYRRSKGLAPRSVRLITSAEVEEIYFTSYWLASGCELLPPSLALVHFDWAVNHGTHGAIKTLQQVVGTAADGIVGPNTKNALALSLKTLGERALVSKYCQHREGCYRRWATGKQQVFLAGWLNRLNALRRQVT